MVDFAIILQRDGALRTAFNRVPANRDGFRSFNHTSHEPIVDTPIAVSIETKRAGEGLKEAETQLGIWAAAHYNRLEELIAGSGRNAGNPLPYLPLLLAQGPEWSFMLAWRDQSRTTVGKQPDILVDTSC